MSELGFEWDQAKNRANHCYRSANDIIRIISARPADPQERVEYDRRTR